jgi:HK97 family phage prohead protease
MPVDPNATPVRDVASTEAESFYRSWQPDIGVRSQGDGRTIFGIAVPYGMPVRIDSTLVEQFARGAFNHQLRSPNRVKFAREHILLGGHLIGAVTQLRDDAAGLYFEARAARTPKGDETVELVKEGALDEVSIYFRERQNRTLPGGVVERVTANLFEIASVFQGAYGRGALVAGVRSAGPGIAAGVDSYHGVPLDGPDLDTLDLRAKAEQYFNLPVLDERRDMEIKRLRLGM